MSKTEKLLAEVSAKLDELIKIEMFTANFLYETQQPKQVEIPDTKINMPLIKRVDKETKK